MDPDVDDAMRWLRSALLESQGEWTGDVLLRLVGRTAPGAVESLDASERARLRAVLEAAVELKGQRQHEEHIESAASQLRELYGALERRAHGDFDGPPGWADTAKVVLLQAAAWVRRLVIVLRRHGYVPARLSAST